MASRFHTYTFDSAGRAKADAVTVLPSGVDGAVRRIERAYDDMSRLKTLTSYDAATAGNVVNQVEWAYNGWGVVSQAKQEHDGAVDANTPKVAYAYDDGATGGEAKFVRLASMTYPDGRQVYYNIPTSGVGQKLARVDNIADDASGTNEYAQYQYIGGSMIVSIEHPDVSGGLNLSYGASGTYDGWDRFGRIVDQNWTDDSAATIDEIGHSYDRNSNRLTRTNGLNSALDEVYTYDGLDRLIDTNRNGANLQDWSLDSLGNWRGFTDGAATQTRTNNAANEITGIAGVGWIAPVYDAAGNMTSGPKPGDEATRLHFTYDAWNRLAEVKDDNAGVPGTTIASYEYDGRNYRIEKTVGADTSDVYYNEAWQVLEVRHNGDTDPLEQNVWDLRYVDAPVVRFYDANVDGDYADAGDSILYYTQDANFNVTALVDAATGNVVERYSYDPYGKATVYDANWTVRPTGSAYNNEVGYAGYRLDPETALYQVRNRFYHTALATWLSRDSLGYDAGDLNLYRYVADNPTNVTDPTGLVVATALPELPDCCSGKNCKWSASWDIWGEGWLLGTAHSEFFATGKDDTGCRYTVSGKGAGGKGGLGASGGLFIGWPSLSYSVTDFPAPCQWPVQPGSVIHTVLVGASAALGLYYSWSNAGSFSASSVGSASGWSMVIGLLEIKTTVKEVACDITVSPNS